MTSKSTDLPPPADATARDEFDRLVEISWSSGPAAAASEGRDCWWVAIDGSAHAQRAVALAARLAVSAPGGVIHLVHVHHWLVKEAAETELAQRGWAASAGARAALDQAGVAWRLHVRMGEIAPEIVRLCTTHGGFGIVIGSHGLTAVQSLMLGSVAYKVVHLCALPVVIAR